MNPRPSTAQASRSLHQLQSASPTNDHASASPVDDAWCSCLFEVTEQGSPDNVNHGGRMQPLQGDGEEEDELDLMMHPLHIQQHMTMNHHRSLSIITHIDTCSGIE